MINKLDIQIHICLRYNIFMNEPLNDKSISETLNVIRKALQEDSVDNIEKTCEIIEKIGGSVVNQPALADDKKVKVAYCHDIEGVLMEIVEVIE